MHNLCVCVHDTVVASCQGPRIFPRPPVIWYLGLLRSTDPLNPCRPESACGSIRYPHISDSFQRRAKEQLNSKLTATIKSSSSGVTYFMNVQIPYMETKLNISERWIIRISPLLEFDHGIGVYFSCRKIYIEAVKLLRYSVKHVDI